MTTKEVSEKYGVCIAAVARWAKNNGVGRGEPVNGIMPFNWTEEDCRRFERRRGPGRRGSAGSAAGGKEA